MIFETVEAEGLSHFSYVFGDEVEGECVVIDPRRDVDVYLDIARRQRAQIVRILETHIHADFVSGSRELNARTGAPIGVGGSGEYGFSHRPLADGDKIEIGEFTLSVLHTPGHTREHVCFLVSGGAGAGEPWGLFTGDTLFAGEVGRPDIPGDKEDEALAGQLYESLHQKILSLDDGIVIYPAHGEGSPCGADIGARPTSTIGYERQNNRFLRMTDKATFVEELLSALPDVPSYYPHMKRVNRQGPPVLGQLPFLQTLSVSQFEDEMQKPDTLILDLREIVAFGGAHIPDSLNIGLREAFPMWAGRTLADIERRDSRLLLVLPDERDAERARTELLRVGQERIAGYLRQGFRGWTDAGRPLAHLPQMSIHTLLGHVEMESELQIVDVRSQEEWETGHIPGAVHIHVPDLPREVEQLDKNRAVATYCGSGYRASIAASQLKRQGFNAVFNVPGSITAWEEAGYPLTE